MGKLVSSPGTLRTAPKRKGESVWEPGGFAAQLVNGLGHPAFSSNSDGPAKHIMNAVDPDCLFM